MIGSGEAISCSCVGCIVNVAGKEQEMGFDSCLVGGSNG